MKNIVYIALAFLVLLSQSCGKNPENQTPKPITENSIAIVMNSTMDFDKSKTIGEALNNWDECKERKWSEFLNANGDNAVQFICSSANIDKFIQQTKSILDKPDSIMANAIKGKHFQIQSVITRFQWTKSKSGRFEITDVNNVWTWKDGKSQKNQNDAEPLLKTIYANETTFNLKYYQDPESLIATRTAVGYARMFQKLYSLAK